MANSVKDTIQVEMNDEFSGILNGDWNEKPQLRFYTSQLLAGAIMIDRTSSIILNTIGPYSRDINLDPHYECTSSFPTTPGPNGFLKICIVTTYDGKRLVLETGTNNYLVTSSITLDIVSVNIGLTTSHFEPTPSTLLYLDQDSIRSAKPMLSDTHLGRSQTMPHLYMLKQIRSKFDNTP